MKKPKNEEEKQDGLEITSIGSLYKGPWDKKYWSSSRGKDRYPYPIGYKAVRNHNGSTYKMEIHEGLNGPLFVISSADEQSCSGQTPDIAWESFQKKGCARIPLLHGKRLSCKIDGTEFFGFRNPFVQRLLRELVSNVNGMAERSLLSSSFCNGASGTEHNTRRSASCADPDLLASLVRPHITGKRNRKRKIITMKSDGRASHKKLGHQDQIYNAEASNSERDFVISDLKESNDVPNHPGTLALLVNLETVVLGKTSSFSVQDVSPPKSVHFSDHLREEALLPQEESRLVENCIITKVANDLSAEEKHPNRSEGTKMLGFTFSVAKEDDNGEAIHPKDAPDINDEDIFVPDSLDILDTASDSTPTRPKEISYNVKDGLISAHMIIREGSQSESSPEEEMTTSASNLSSENSDFDSVGNEMAKSMMTVLLPQALPLLKKYTRKKTKAIKPSETSPCVVKYREDINRSVHIRDVRSPVGMLSENSHTEREEKMHISIKDPESFVSSFEHITSVVPDSFEDDQCEPHVISQVPLPFDMAEAEADPAAYIETFAPDNLRLFGSIKARKELSVCHGCTSPKKMILSERFKDVCTNLNKNSKSVEICCEEKDPKTATEDASDVNLRDKVGYAGILQKEINTKIRDARTSKTSFAQIPDSAPLSKKCECPFSESIICGNSGVGCVPEEILQMSSSDNIPNKKVSVDAEARFPGQLHGLCTKNTTPNPKAVFYNDPVISHNKSFFCASENKDTAEFLSPPLSRVEKSNKGVGHELAKQQNFVKFKSSDPQFQTSETNLFDKTTSDASEVHTDSDLKPHMNKVLNNDLKDFVKLVGCYVHPMPVLSVLLNTKDHEILICVLCGLVVDSNRALFIYKLSIEGPGAGCPSFAGHASLTFPISKDAFGRKVLLDRSGLQFTPDGQCLVLLNSVKAPYCREQKIHCLCSACTSDCFEDNAVKIVQVKLGYITVMAKLKTDNSVHCVLVCEPNHLIAVEDGGRLRLWVMNSTWSAPTEEFVIPISDCMSPHIMELKKIPKSSHLVIGHNGFGDFGLWDISNRILISKFSIPSLSVFQFLPISLIDWKSKGPVSNYSSAGEHINKLWLSEHCMKLSLKDMAIWLLVSTGPNCKALEKYESDCQVNESGCWRLALLVKNRVILGSPLDPRAVAIGASDGHGIITTSDGLVYMWELYTGVELGTLHYFKGGGVSCVVTDEESKSGVLAVAGDGGKLLIYLHSRGDK